MQVLIEWRMVRGVLYKHADNKYLSQDAAWARTIREIGEGNMPNILRIYLQGRVTPLASTDPERGFSLSKNIKAPNRARMHTATLDARLRIKQALPASVTFDGLRWVGEPPSPEQQAAGEAGEAPPNVLRIYEKLVQGGDNMNREKLLFEKLHEALHVSEDKYWKECCAQFADLGDPEAPEPAPDADDELGMPVEELAALLEQGV